MNGPRVAVVTSGSPEMLHCAAELQVQGALRHLVHPLLISAAAMRYLDKSSRARPLVGRTIPHGIDADLVASAAPATELLRGLVTARAPRTGAAMMRRRNRILRRRARSAAGSGKYDTLFVSHGLAFEAVARKRDCRVVLNMPSCHPRMRNQLLIEESDASGERLAGIYSESELQEFDVEFDGSDLILVGSEFAKRSLCAFGVRPGKIRVVPYGVDLDTFGPLSDPLPAAPGHYLVLTVGSLLPGKGYRYLSDALETISATHRVRWNVVGAADISHPWLDVGGVDVRVLGRKNSSELAELYQQASVFVHPTLFEGMSLVSLEAMACGVPVVATDRGPDQVVRDGVDGLVVPAADAQALGGALVKLFGDEQLRTGMGRHAAARAREFSWATYAKAAARSISAVQ